MEYKVCRIHTEPNTIMKYRVVDTTHTLTSKTYINQKDDINTMLSVLLYRFL